jgi:hypothetical protein
MHLFVKIRRSTQEPHTQRQDRASPEAVRIGRVQLALYQIGQQHGHTAVLLIQGTQNSVTFGGSDSQNVQLDPGCKRVCISVSWWASNSPDCTVVCGAIRLLSSRNPSPNWSASRCGTSQCVVQATPEPPVGESDCNPTQLSHSQSTIQAIPCLLTFKSSSLTILARKVNGFMILRRAWP